MKEQRTNAKANSYRTGIGFSYFLMILLLSGCGSMINRSLSHPTPYGGVIFDLGVACGPLLHKGNPDPVFDPFAPFAILDLPLSTAADTLLLPVDSINWAGSKRTQKNKKGELLNNNTNVGGN
jgi:uncharacterized protein YceK